MSKENIVFGGKGYWTLHEKDGTHRPLTDEEVKKAEMQRRIFYKYKNRVKGNVTSEDIMRIKSYYK